MEVIYLNDAWPFRVETFLPNHAPLTVDSAQVSIFRLDDSTIALPVTAVPSSNIFSGYVEYIVTTPVTATEGNYIIDWDITLGTAAPLSHRQFFQVVTIPTYTLIEQQLINALRIRLKDNDPARYRVDETEEKWHDEELYSFLFYALADVNGQPPFWTDYDFTTLPAQMHFIVLLAAQIFALIAEATLQAANDFSYNDNGLTVTLSRSGKYMAIAGQLWNMYSTMIFRIKRYLGFSLTSWVGIKTQRMPISVRRPLSMLPHLESTFGM